jgi:hypothetical protein
LPRVTALGHIARLLPGRLLLILLTAWALALIVPGLYRTVTPFAAFGLSVDNDGLVTDVRMPFPIRSESPAARAGIARGDRIDLAALGCRITDLAACGDALTLLGGLGGVHLVMPSSTLRLTIQPHGEGTVRTIQLQAVRQTWNGLESLVLLADTLVGIAVVLTAFRLVWTRPGPMTWGFFLYAIWFNPGQSYTAYALLGASPYLTFAEEAIEAAAQAAAYVGLLVFALHFPDDVAEPGWRLAHRALGPLAAALLALNAASFANVFGFATEGPTRITFFAGLAVDALALVILLRRRRSLTPRDDQRMRWVIAGCVIGLPAFIFAELCQSVGLFDGLWGGEGVPTAIVGLIYLLSGVLVWFVSEAVRRPRVISVAIPLRHGTVMTVLTLIAAEPVFFAHEWLGKNRDLLDVPEEIWILVVGPLLVVALNRLHDVVVHAADRAFSQSYHRAQAALARISAALKQAQTFADVDLLLTADAAAALRLASAAVFRPDGGIFRKQASVGWEAGVAEVLDEAADATLLRRIGQPEPVRLARGDHAAAWPRAVLPADEARPCLALPVRDLLGETMAIVAYGAHVTGNEIDPDETHMLQTLAGRAAAAYERVAVELLRREVTELRAALRIAQTASPGQA